MRSHRCPECLETLIRLGKETDNAYVIAKLVILEKKGHYHLSDLKNWEAPWEPWEDDIVTPTIT